MMLTMSSLVILGLGLLAIVLPHMRFGKAEKTMTDSMHRAVCLCVFAAGCIVRFYRLGSLPEGSFAEEALVGVQAKALWQTGGFLFEGGLTTQFAQWAGESTGPLLAVMTAPFVGILGMTPFSVRLPLALLSCAAMAAAYGLGHALGGKRAGRWCLTAYALCPYFVLMARMACGANAAVYLLPIALYAVVKGLTAPAFLYIGMGLLGLMAYTQDMYFLIAPAAVAACGIAAAAYGVRKRHALGAAALGLLICLPALLTLWVNLTDAQGFTWMGAVQIPKLEAFDKADSLFDVLEKGKADAQIRSKAWAVITGAFFQVLAHMNISTELFAPNGMGALYVLSIPLMLLGLFGQVHNLLNGQSVDRRYAAARMMVTVLFVITLLSLILYGSVGVLDVTGVTSVFDYSALFLFDVLLMAAGLCRLERKSSAGISAMTTLLAACFVMLCVHLFGSAYRDNLNVYFHGFSELSAKAEQIHEDTGAKVNVTGTVYPHISPSDAAEMMYLYAIDADMREVCAKRGETYEVFYAPGIENPDAQQIYLAAQGDAAAWDLSAFHYEEMGEYVLLSPIAE